MIIDQNFKSDKEKLNIKGWLDRQKSFSGY
jgi:hypothetical protein